MDIHHSIIYYGRLAPRSCGYYYGVVSEANAPYISLGNHLKYVREQAKQSLAEVSGAVEIDEHQLERIEAGKERPAEDVLLLLISHFGLHDREAVQLWEQAAYDNDMPDEVVTGAPQPANGKPAIMLLAVDMRAIYSDGLELTTTPTGITFNFTQSNGKTLPATAAKIGMSLDQAEVVLQTLQQAILHAKYNSVKKIEPPKPE